ncbi:DNA polymerase III subunit delta' [soil metagenome]
MWKNIIGQERVVEILKNIITGKNLAHAYIFYGKDGVGKDAAAIELTKAINCDNPINGNEACDKCKPCLEIQKFSYPLFKFVTAIPGTDESESDSNMLAGLKEDQYENYIEELNNKSEDPYYRINIEGANNIKISTIRNIIRSIKLTGLPGKYKTYIISGCDRMNAASSNSLLKVLEEPPANSILILTTSKINSLLPTITGRCLKLSFDSINKAGIIEYLRSRDISLNERELNFYAELSEGSISKLNSILGTQYHELRENVIEVLRAIVTFSTLNMSSLIDKITGKKDKQRIIQFLALLQIWFRDILYKKAGNDELIINSDKDETLTKMVNGFEWDIYSILNLIEASIKEVNDNLNAELLLFNLFLSIKGKVTSK